MELNLEDFIRGALTPYKKKKCTDCGTRFLIIVLKCSDEGVVISEYAREIVQNKILEQDKWSYIFFSKTPSLLGNTFVTILPPEILRFIFRYKGIPPKFAPPTTFLIALITAKDVHVPLDQVGLTISPAWLIEMRASSSHL